MCDKDPHLPKSGIFKEYEGQGAEIQDADRGICQSKNVEIEWRMPSHIEAQLALSGCWRVPVCKFKEMRWSP